MRAITENTGKCWNCNNVKAEIFQTDGELCLNCWQKITEPDIPPKNKNIS